MPVAEALLALSVSAHWPDHWLAEGQEGVLEVEYRVTEECGIEVVSLKAEPNTLSFDGAREILENTHVQRNREIDMESVYESVPGLNIGDVHSDEQYAQVLEAVEDLGPWAETRSISINGRTVICEISPGGSILKATYSGRELGADSLPSIPKSMITISFEIVDSSSGM